MGEWQYIGWTVFITRSPSERQRAIVQTSCSGVMYTLVVKNTGLIQADVATALSIQRMAPA